MDSILQDLRFALRTFGKKPGFTLIVVLTLALGIGANTTVFSLLNAVVLKPLPYEGADRIMGVGQTWPDSRDRLSTTSWRNFNDWRDRQKSFEKLAAYYVGGVIMTGNDSPQRLRGAVVSSDFFSIFKVEPELGRVFQPVEDTKGGGPEGLTVVLSSDAWRKYFGGDPNILGRKVTLDGREYRVIGVMPQRFAFPLLAKPIELWTSVGHDAERVGPGSIMESRGYCVWNVVGRLKKNASPEQAGKEMGDIGAEIAREFPDTNKESSVAVKPVLDQYTGKIAQSLKLLLWSVSLVLLIACANVANLLLGRGVSRRREIAIRSAVGAGSGRIFRQLLTECLLLAMVGGGLGTLLAWKGAQLMAAIGPRDLPRLDETGIDGRVLLFALGLSLATGLLFGLIPAFQSYRENLFGLFKESGTTATDSRGRSRLRGALVVAEISFALVLLTGSGLLMRSFLKLQSVDPGFNPEGLQTFVIEMTDKRYESPENTVAVYRDIREGIAKLPGVTSVSAVSWLPFSGDEPSTGVSIQGRTFEKGKEPSAILRLVGTDYFKTMSIALVKGRATAESDTLASPNVVVVNEAFAQRLFPNEDAIGKRISPSFSTRKLVDPMWTIVGVVKNSKRNALDEKPEPEMFFPLTQMPYTGLTFVVRGDIPTTTLIPATRGILARADRTIPIYGIRSLNEYISLSMAEPRLYTTLLGAFATLALTLSAIGLFGVMSFFVSQRTAEIGIRMALGANSADALKLVIGQGLKLTFLGLAIGLTAAFYLSRLLAGLLFDVTPNDPLTFSLVTIVLGFVALLACWIPARRAAMTDPLKALRHES
jgi:putative ABC transport system permease protein